MGKHGGALCLIFISVSPHVHSSVQGISMEPLLCARHCFRCREFRKLTRITCRACCLLVEKGKQKSRLITAMTEAPGFCGAERGEAWKSAPRGAAVVEGGSGWSRAWNSRGLSESWKCMADGEQSLGIGDRQELSAALLSVHLQLSLFLRITNEGSAVAFLVSQATIPSPPSSCW